MISTDQRVRGIPRYFRFPWRSARQVHREVDEELFFHLYCRIDELVSSGLSEEEAEQQAHREFGDLAAAQRLLKAEGRRHEASRRRQVMFSEWFTDIKYACRSLTKSPGFTAVAILVLALGIGANATIFNLLNMLLMRPIMVDQPEQLVGVYSQDTERTDSYSGFSYPTYVDLRAQNDVFENLAAHTIKMAGLKEGSDTRRIMVSVVSSNYFETLGVAPAQGRSFTSEEEGAEAAPVAIVSHEFWLRNGRDEVLNSVIRLNGHQVTVIGVAPKGFTGTSAMFSPEAWLPFGLYDSINSSFGASRVSQLNDRENTDLILFGRWKTGMGSDLAAPRLASLAQRLEEAYPKALEDQTFITAKMPRLSISTVPDTERTLWIPSLMLMFMAAIVLMIACLNLANMFLARGAARRTELAIRLSLGGGRFRLLRQILSEGLVLSIVGGALGLGLAVYGSHLLFSSMASLLPAGFNFTFNTSPDWRVFLATLVFCVAATVLSGFGPAWKLSSGDLVAGLKENGQSLAGDGKRRWAAPRNLMMIAQIALSTILLSAGGLFVRGAWIAADANPGFSLENSLLMELDTSLVNYDENQSRATFQRVQSYLRSYPGVESVSLASVVPFGPVANGRSVHPFGNYDDESAISANYYVIGDQYFDSLGMPLVQGRDFTASEAGPGTDHAVAIVSTQLADKLWPDQPALGQLIEVKSGTTFTSMEVVGVAQGFRHNMIDKQPLPMLFVPIGQNFTSSITFHIRLAEGTDLIDSAFLQSIHEGAQALDPLLPILSLKTFLNFRDESLFLWLYSSAAKIFSALGLVALFLALVGVYGVKSFIISRRTREVGIRLTLGATRGEVVRQMLRESLMSTGIALTLGVILAAQVAKLLSNMLYETQGSYWILGAAALFLALATLLAAFVPSLRATKIEPTVALRQD